MSMNEKGLIDLKDVITKTKAEADRIKGKLEHLREQLKKDHNCTTLKEAKLILGNLEAEKDELENEIESMMNKIEEKYNE